MNSRLAYTVCDEPVSVEQARVSLWKWAMRYFVYSKVEPTKELLTCTDGESKISQTHVRITVILCVTHRKIPTPKELAQVQMCSVCHRVTQFTLDRVTQFRWAVLTGRGPSEEPVYSPTSGRIDWFNSPTSGSVRFIHCWATRTPRTRLVLSGYCQMERIQSLP